jgi:hypothetical protein
VQVTQQHPLALYRRTCSILAKNTLIILLLGKAIEKERTSLLVEME